MGQINLRSIKKHNILNIRLTPLLINVTYVNDELPYIVNPSWQKLGPQTSSIFKEEVVASFESTTKTETGHVSCVPVRIFVPSGSDERPSAGRMLISEVRGVSYI